MIGVMICLLAACGQGNDDDPNAGEQADEEMAATPVEVGKVSQGDLVKRKQFYGRTMPTASTPVVPPVAGEIDQLNIAKGEMVEEDDVIAMITRADQGGTIDITAPASGQITSLEAREGSIVSNTEPLAVIIDLDTIQIQLGVTANNLDLFNNRKSATVHFNDIELETTATVEHVASVSDETGLYPIEFEVDNPDKKIKAGMVATIFIKEIAVEDTLLIPTEALVEQTNQTFVYVVDGGQVKKTDVTVTESQTSQTAIEASLREGDTIVTGGQLTLTDGASVRIVKEDR